MSLPEIKRSVFSDYQTEVCGREEMLKIAYRAKWMRTGRKDFVETVSVPVKSRNIWRITILCDSRTVTTIPYLISYNDKGVTASQIMTMCDGMPLMHFNSHFFKRYRERAKINADKPEQVIKHFFRKNLHIVPCTEPRADGTEQLFAPLNGGIALGNFHTDPDICEFKTFVDNSLLRIDQQITVMEIWTETMTEITTEMQRRLDKKNKVISTTAR